MKVRFVWMTPSKGLMVHLVPDIMLIPTESSFAIVAGWLNMHLSFKFKKKHKTEKDTLIYKADKLTESVENLKCEMGKTDLMQGITKLAQAWAGLVGKGGEE